MENSMNEQTEQESEATELMDRNLDTVAGGGAVDIDGIDVIIKRKPVHKVSGSSAT